MGTFGDRSENGLKSPLFWYDYAAFQPPSQGRKTLVNCDFTSAAILLAKEVNHASMRTENPP